MEDKQFEILMKTIGGINEKLDKLEESTKEEIKSLKEGQKNIMDEQIKGFNRLEKMFKDHERINDKDHTMIMKEMGYRYIELKDESERTKEDLNALHFLSKTNEAQHKEYDELLSIKRA